MIIIVNIIINLRFLDDFKEDVNCIKIKDNVKGDEIISVYESKENVTGQYQRLKIKMLAI